MIKRQSLVNLHLYLAAFFAPVLLIMAFTGGMYLLGIKGSQDEKVIFELSASQVSFDVENKVDTVSQILKLANIEHSFEAVVGGGDNLLTRPSSKQHYLIKREGQSIFILERNPDLIRSLVELHKGHGPALFKVFQQFMAAGLIFILVSGLLLGVLSPVLRNKTTLIASSGVVAFILLAII